MFSHPPIRPSLPDPVASGAASDARDAQNKVEAMSHDIERLLMITEALWEVLKTHHGYADADLMELVHKIDLRDGKLDGRVAKEPPKPCPKCGRTAARLRPLCLYCGCPIPQSPFAR
ncbi:MAG: hypothetical protein NTZ16_09920 [Verrucomicrobia bacterium]|nr:hypothetical protein [Verrucomicrobiota bacterium]